MFIEAMNTQWQYHGKSGHKMGINYNAIQTTENKTGIKLKSTKFFIFQQLEIEILNIQAKEL